MNRQTNNDRTRGMNPIVVQNTNGARTPSPKRKRKGSAYQSTMLLCGVIAAASLIAAVSLTAFAVNNSSSHKPDSADTPLPGISEPADKSSESDPLSVVIPGTAATSGSDTSARPAETTAKETETTAPEVTTAPETTKAPEETQAPAAPGSANVSSKGYPIEERNGVTYVNGILIANKTYSVPSSYGNGITSETQAALDKMFAAARAEGISLSVRSGFRSYATQQSLYQRYCDRDGKAAADTYSARAGYSEHQTGLAADINSLETSWGQTREGKWLAANCYKYGFIIRYPEGKEHITGYQYEPWHIRYLGVETATEVYESGLTLEEFLGITSVYAD